VVVFVSHNDSVIGVTADARWPIQLTGQLPLGSKMVKELSFRGENFNSTVRSIGNLYVINVNKVEFNLGQFVSDTKQEFQQ